MNLCSHKYDFGISAECFFFSKNHGESRCDSIGEAVKRNVAKRSFQMPLNNQILDYKAF